MRKANNIFLMLFLATIAVGLYSCSDDLVKSDYDYKPDSSAKLAAIQFNTLEKFSDEAITLSATISDQGESPIYDQGFIYSTDQSFTTYTAISVTPQKDSPTQLKDTVGINQGQELYFKAFVMTKDGLATSTEAKSINLPVTWEKVGTVLFKSTFYGDDEGEVEIQKFFGQNRYRLLDLYNKLYPDDIPAGKHLEFFLDDDANAVSLPLGDQDILGPPYTFHWDNQGGFRQYCTFTNTANVYELGAVVKENGEIKYIFTASFEWVDGYPGEIPEPVEPLEVSYKTDFSNAAAQAGWVLDRFSGVGEDDLVFFFDTAEAGAPDWGTAIAAYHETDPLTIVSPSITVAPNDTLSFGLYSGLFDSGVNAKVKVYIREDGGELDLTSPVKNWDLPKGGGLTAIPLKAYEGKGIKVIYIVEQGDFLFYKFAVAPSTDQNLIFQ